MYLILHDLLAQYDHAWIIDHLVVYADDFHMRWIVHSPADGLRAMHDLSFLMRVLGAYGLRRSILTRTLPCFDLLGRHFHHSRKVGLADRPMAPCYDCLTWLSLCRWLQKRRTLVPSFRTGHGKLMGSEDVSQPRRHAFAFYAGGSWTRIIRSKPGLSYIVNVFCRLYCMESLKWV